MSDTTVTKKTSVFEQRRKFSARFIAGTAILAAIAFILQFLEFPISLLIPPFIKFDFSDLPALIGAFAYGPIAGILIELIKNLLHCLVSQSFGVGELSNFLLGAVFTLVAGLIYRFNRTKKGAIIGAVVGSFVMGIASVPFNYFVVYPTYYAFFEPEAILGMYQAILPKVKNIFQCLLVFNLPFTIVKGLISTLITIFIYKPLSPFLHGRNKE